MGARVTRVRARTQVAVGPGGIVRRLECMPPMTVRQVRTDVVGEAALCLVNTAAGPLGGDDLELCLQIEPGARASVAATGASLAQGGASSHRTTIHVGAGAAVHARLGPLIVSADATLDVSLDVALAADAALRWREVVVLGRTSQPAGRVTLRWDVTRDGRPVLRQRVALGPDSWRGARDGCRVLAAAFVTEPTLIARTVVRSPHAVAARLDEHTLLATVLANDAATAQSELDALCGDV